MDTKSIDKYIEIGKRDKDWYARCTKLFIDLFGEDKLRLVCELFAATSINTSLKSNITLFRKALYEIENDLPVGRYLPNIQNQLYRIRSGQELSGRKIRSFAKAMAGDKNAVVVDIWLLRAFEMDRKYFRKDPQGRKGRGIFRSAGATDKEYTIIERWVRRRAKKMGCHPSELSAIIWAGVRIISVGDRETHYHDRLKQSFTNLFNVI